MDERRLHFPVVDLVAVRMTVAGVLIGEAVNGPVNRLERIFERRPQQTPSPKSAKK
jgi:hypothetical protein